MTRNLIVVCQITFDGLCQGLAQLNAPLIERVDVPNDTLSEDLVLVCGDESSQCEWSQLLDNNRICWTIAGKDFVWNEILQFLSLHAGLLQIATSLLLGLAKSEGFSLGQEVSQQHLVMDAASDWVVSLSGGDEVSWDYTCSL